MRNIILLLMAMLKGNGLADLGGDRAKKKKKARISGKGSIAILGFAAIYMGGLAVIYVKSGFEFLKPLGLESLILGLAISVIAFLVFFMGLFYIMSVFYFSSDVEKLLPLPVKPGELLVAKFLVTLVYEYMVTVIILAPAMVTYGILNNSGVLYYVYMTVGILLLPIIPLILASVIIMLLMRFSPAARNKDRFTLIASVFALLVGFGISFGMQAVLSNSDAANFGEILSASADKISRISSSIFPGTYFVNYALAKPEGWDSFGMILAFIAITAIACAALYALGNLIYFKGVIGIGSSGSKGRKLSTKEMDESTVSGNAFVTYVKKDIMVLMRTPIFFMNNVIVNFLLPVFMVVPLFMQSSENGLQISKLREIAKTTLFTGDLKIASYILVGFFAFITFTCGTNGISESAISREGNCAYLMKIIPMSYRHQIWAKITVGIIMSVLGSLLILVMVVALVTPPLWFDLLLLAIIPGAVLLPNITGIVFDLYMPKIKWDNEQKAVKQNMNVLYGILVSTVIIALMAAAIVTIPFTFPVAALFIIFVPLILALLSAQYVNSIINRTMMQLAA